MTVMLMRTAACVSTVILLMACPATIHADPRGVACLSLDGTILATEEKDCTVTLRDVSSGTKIISLYEPEDRIPAPQMISCYNVLLSCSPDGKLLATQRSFEPIILWNMPEGSRVATLDGASVRERVQTGVTLEFSSNSKLILSTERVYRDKTRRADRITVWDVATRKELLGVRPDEDTEFNKVALSPDGKTVMAVGGSKEDARPQYTNARYRTDSIRLWDVQPGEELVTLKGSTASSASFSPDGKFLLITDPASEPRLWDIKAGQMRLPGKRESATRPRSK